MQLILLTFIIVMIIGAGIYWLRILPGKPKDENPWPYKTKKYFFSRSEQVFLHMLNKSINTERYVVYPKVRIADFVDITTGGKERLKWWNKIKSKHIDFLIWDTQEQRIALAIELDGKSHKKEDSRISDEFKNKLCNTINIRLERIKVGSDFAAEIGRLEELLVA